MQSPLWANQCLTGSGIRGNAYLLASCVEARTADGMLLCTSAAGASHGVTKILTSEGTTSSRLVGEPAGNILNQIMLHNGKMTSQQAEPLCILTSTKLRLSDTSLPPAYLAYSACSILDTIDMSSHQKTAILKCISTCCPSLTRFNEC